MQAKKKTAGYIMIIMPWVVLVVFLASTHPAALPVYALLVPFILLGIALYVTQRAITGKLMGHSSKHQKTITALSTVFLVICAGLQSVGQLTFRDFMIVLLLTLLGYFYLYRNIIGTKDDK